LAFKKTFSKAKRGVWGILAQILQGSAAAQGFKTPLYGISSPIYQYDRLQEPALKKQAGSP